MNANDNTIDTTSPEFVSRAVKNHHALVTAVETLAEKFPIRNENDAAIVAFAYIVLYNARVTK
jgi:hypothetical protein